MFAHRLYTFCVHNSWLVQIIVLDEGTLHFLESSKHCRDLHFEKQENSTILEEVPVSWKCERLPGLNRLQKHVVQNVSRLKTMIAERIAADSLWAFCQRMPHFHAVKHLDLWTNQL
jgi:hypothetical protein